MPGVSTYMQDIGEGRLLAVGYGGTEEGLNWQTSISLFDTSDFSNPALIDSLSLKEEGLDNNWFFQSAANHDHSAVITLLLQALQPYRCLRATWNGMKKTTN